jgi:GNAT superfamily N-acetyltransferase
MAIFVSMMPDAYSIHRFPPEALPAYKAIRLEALQTEPGFFGNSYDFEAALTDAQWAARLSNASGACFGLYHGDELIGLTGIVVSDPGKPREAYMTQSYIRKEHRGLGLSRLLYEARLAWANEYGIIRLVIGHRESNAASKAANQHFGFHYTHSESRNWPDGHTEDMCYYELYL